jgi:hypothetical protein
VPSTFPLPVLAAFFHLHPEPDPWIENLLSKWVWRGWANGFGRGGQTPVLRRAIQIVNPVKGAPGFPSEYEAVKRLLDTVARDVPTLNLQESRTDTANGRLALLALASLGPLNLAGQKIDVAAKLEEQGVAAITELVTQHRANLAARGFWPIDAPAPTGHEDIAILASHAITEGAAAALRSRDVEAFLGARGETMSQLTNRFLTVRIDPDAVVRPPLSELTVPDVLDEGELSSEPH